MKLLLEENDVNNEPIMIQFLDLSHKPKQYEVIEFFPDCSFDTAQDRLIKTRRQQVEGRTFVVSSIFERGASQSASEKLRRLVERDAEKDCRNAL